jgi:hypothetical protein
VFVTHLAVVSGGAWSLVISESGNWISVEKELHGRFRKRFLEKPSKISKRNKEQIKDGILLGVPKNCLNSVMSNR